MVFYKCNVCGNMVELVNKGGGTLMCCGEEMERLKEQYKEGDKHVPIIIRQDDKYIVKVGNTPHPMTQEHYIKIIELEVDGVKHRRSLEPGDKPEAVFNVPKGNNVKAREYCTLHGLWASEENAN